MPPSTSWRSSKPTSTSDGGSTSSSQGSSAPSPTNPQNSITRLWTWWPANGTSHDDQLRRLDEAGVGAVVLPSLFEEQLEHDALAIDAMLETNAGVFAEAETFFPELDDYNTGADRYLISVERAKEAVSVPVIATGSWKAL